MGVFLQKSTPLFHTNFKGDICAPSLFQITLQLGLESVTTLSKEVKKLSKKNSRLSRALDLRERRPPVCTVCLEGMLLQQEGGSSEGGAVMQSGEGGGGRVAPESADGAAAASRVAPGRASRVPFNLNEALQGRSAAAVQVTAGSTGGSARGSGVGGQAVVTASLPTAARIAPGDGQSRWAVVTGRRDMDSLLDTQLWKVGALPAVATAGAAGEAGSVTVPRPTATASAAEGGAWALGAQPATDRAVAGSVAPGGYPVAAPKGVQLAGPVVARPGGVLRFPRRDVSL